MNFENHKNYENVENIRNTKSGKNNKGKEKKPNPKTHTDIKEQKKKNARMRQIGWPIFASRFRDGAPL